MQFHGNPPMLILLALPLVAQLHSTVDFIAQSIDICHEHGSFALGANS